MVSHEAVRLLALDMSTLHDLALGLYYEATRDGLKLLGLLAGRLHEEKYQSKQQLSGTLV